MRTIPAARMLTWLLVVLLAWPAALFGQPAGEPTPVPQTYAYSQEQLDELLAPIALYPDTLLSQILMASTYPLEVVEADRWLKQNPNLTGDALDGALKDKPWDVSVKSLCHFPQVLSMMDERLQDTTDLGNAFLGQQDQVMDTIQKLRSRAQAQGNLRSTEQQRVVVQDQDIVIEPVYPDVVYVPAYDPCWAYGPWWYPTCSPLWFWYPGIVVGAGFFWGPRIFVGPIDFWCGFHWRQHSIFVNVNRTAFIGRVGATRMHGGVETWVHNPAHRRGVAYRDAAAAQRFGRANAPGVEPRRAFRGFGPQGGGQAATARPEFGRPESRGPSASAQGTPEVGRPAPESRGPSGAITAGHASAPQPGRAPVSQPRGGGAFQGFGKGGVEAQQQSERGRQSMGNAPGGGVSMGARPRAPASVSAPAAGPGGDRGGPPGGGRGGGGKRGR